MATRDGGERQVLRDRFDESSVEPDQDAGNMLLADANISAPRQAAHNTGADQSGKGDHNPWDGNNSWFGQNRTFMGLGSTRALELFARACRGEVLMNPWGSGPLV